MARRYAETFPPHPRRESPNEEMLEHAVVQSKQTLLFMLQWRQQLEQTIAVQQKQVGLIWAGCWGAAAARRSKGRPLACIHGWLGADGGWAARASRLAGCRGVACRS